MADHKYFDATHPLGVPTANALIELAASDTVFLALGAQSATLLGIKGAGNNQVLIHSAGVVHTQLNALEILGNENRIHNEGFVTSIAGTGVLLSGGGTNRRTPVHGHPLPSRITLSSQRLVSSIIRCRLL